MLWLGVGAVVLLAAVAAWASQVFRGKDAEVAAYFRAQLDELDRDSEATTGFVVSGGGGTAEEQRSAATSAVPGTDAR